MNYIYSIVFFWSPLLYAETEAIAQSITRSWKGHEVYRKGLPWLLEQCTSQACTSQTTENWPLRTTAFKTAIFNRITTNQIPFYELHIIKEILHILVLTIKSFNPNIIVRETKDKTLDTSLLQRTPTQAVFESLCFKKMSTIQTRAYMDIKNDERQLKRIQFNYKKT